MGRREREREEGDKVLTRRHLMWKGEERIGGAGGGRGKWLGHTQFLLLSLRRLIVQKNMFFLADFFDVLGPAVCHFRKRGLGSKFGQM